jgi:septation ring formation regulator EzrA
MPKSEIEQLREELAAKDIALREVHQKLSEVEEELARLHKTTEGLIEAQERGRSFWRRITGK